MDRNLLAADLSSLTESDQARISSVVDQMQTRDSLSLYNKLAQICFSDCVTTFYRKALGKQEELCVRRCTEKFLRLSTSVSTRFAEISQDGSASPQ